MSVALESAERGALSSAGSSRCPHASHWSPRAFGSPQCGAGAFDQAVLKKSSVGHREWLPDRAPLYQAGGVEMVVEFRGERMIGVA